MKNKNSIPFTVKLNFMGETCLIKDVKTKLSKNQDKIYLYPILQTIKTSGKPIQFKSINYFSQRDQMVVFVGVDPIKESKTMPIKDLFRDDEEVHLSPSNPPTINLIIKDPLQLHNQHSFNER